MVFVGTVSFDTDSFFTDQDPGKLFGFYGSGSATLVPVNFAD